MRTKPITLALAVLLQAVAVTLVAREVRADATYTWGDNQTGELGDGTMNNRPTPGAVTGLGSSVTAVAGGQYYGLAVQNGAAYAWGDNTTGQLGDGTSVRRLLPVAISGLGSGVTAVAAGVSHSLALQNGSVYAWGYNGSGALGNGTTGPSSVTPVAVSAPLTSGVTAIAVGNQFSLAIKNGGLYAWGLNNDGELGDGTTTARTTPVAVTGLGSGVTAIAAGVSRSFAVQNGAVYAWGNNIFGLLGDGTTNSTLAPVSVVGLTNGVTAVATGQNHSLAVRNGDVYAWGGGGLGDGTTNFQAVPEQIDPADLHDIIAVAAGASSSYALSSDGSLWVWGDNTFGEMGLGNAFQSIYLTPQHLLPQSGLRFTSIDANAYGASFAIATVAAVPEPYTFVLASIGFVGILTCVPQRRRRSPYCLNRPKASLI